jgi:DNA-binding transcriptional ArsR family regulator
MADDQLSVTFAALADPTRRAILARLADGEATVNSSVGVRCDERAGFSGRGGWLAGHRRRDPLGCVAAVTWAGNDSRDRSRSHPL